MRTKGGTSRLKRAFVMCSAWALAAATISAQTTNSWIVNGNGFWTATNNWMPGTNYPDSPGAVAFVTTNFTANRILYLDDYITLGTLIWGDVDRSNSLDLRTTNAIPRGLYFDTGDGRQALIEHGTGDRPGRNVGNYNDDTDAGVFVEDPDGLFIDNWISFSFHETPNGDINRAFDGGGHSVTKGEDGTVSFNGIVTNISTLWVRDGQVQFGVEGDPARTPEIGNIVIGVAPGVIDVGANPDGVITNIHEGGAYDRIQFPTVSIMGASTTNSSAVGITNDFDLTMNRGVFQTLNRATTNGQPVVYAGGVTLNGDANEAFFQVESEYVLFSSPSSVVAVTMPQTIFAGSFNGEGGLTKLGNGEMVMTGSNGFTGALNIHQGINSYLEGTHGAVRLEGDGVMSGVAAIRLNRSGSLFLDNRTVNVSNRINDAAPITVDGRGKIEILGNGSAASYERFGSVTTAQGSLAIEFDKADGSPQRQTLEIASLVRNPGTVVGFHASDLQQGAFGLNGPTGIVVNLLDGGASLTQIGGGGTAGTPNRNVVVGVFGGDGVDYGSQSIDRQAPNRADELMTVDGGRLRTLDPATEMVSLGGGGTNALFISQASAAPDANVNIDFMTRQVDLTGNISTNVAWLAEEAIVDKRVVGDATFNSIRFGLVRGTDGVPNDTGRSLLIADGIRLASESGMLLFGRDTGSTNGDMTPGGIVSIYGGTLDLDGAANNREAIIQGSSGNAVNIRSSIEASQGLTKSGIDLVALDVANNLGGTVTIAQGGVFLRNSQALHGATDLRVEGDGFVSLGSSIAVTNVDLRIGATSIAAAALSSVNGHNVFGGDIIIERADAQGLPANQVNIRPASLTQSATLTLFGDIGLVGSQITADINLADPVRVAFRDSAGILNLNGTVGDRLVNGQAMPFDPSVTGQSRLSGGSMDDRAANENQVLQVLFDGAPTLSLGGDEMVVNIANPWNAAGRIYAEQGTIRFLGDPASGKGDFWTSNALAVSDFGNSNGGFMLGGPGTEAGASITFLLTKDGQRFNAERWTVATNNNANNTITMGLEHTGPSNATVTIGNEFYDNDPSTFDDQISIGGTGTNSREFRLFAHNGYDSLTGNETDGRVNVIQSIRGNDYSILTKVGNGTVVLQATTNTAIDQSNDIRNFMLLGGELVLDRQSPGLSGALVRASANRAALFLSGGDLTYLGPNGGNMTEMLTSNLTLRAGDSQIAVAAGSGFSTSTLMLATGPNAVVTRQRGGTMNLIEERAVGASQANIRLAGSGIVTGERIGSWATYGTNRGGGAYTWAATDGFSNVVPFAESSYTVDGFGPSEHVHLEAPFLFGGGDAASLRYTNAATLDIAGESFSFDITQGGILVTPTVNGEAAITNGQLTSSGGELIIHNYAGDNGRLGISAAIVGDVDLTFSGTGLTVLSGTNTFSGVTRINGGTVQIDSASRLGNTVSNLELRGGTLFTTANVVLTNRAIILGGDGGTFRVASNTTNFIANVLSESNFLGSTRLNNGHGDLIKTGGGVLNLGVAASASNNLTAGYNMYQGLTDIREGTLRVVTTNAFALGSSKSFYDGTIVRNGATLSIAASNVVGSMPSLQEWLMLEQGSTLRYETFGVPISFPQWHGVIDLRGDAAFRIEAGNSLSLNPGGQGYLMGAGDLIKEGDGSLTIVEYSPEFTGDLHINDGSLVFYGTSQNPVPNANSITLGRADTTNRGYVAFHVRTDRDGYAGAMDIEQDITVRGNSSINQIGVYNFQHNDVLNFNGRIDLAGLGATNTVGELQLYAEDTLSGRTVDGADALREEVFVNLNGDITGGNKHIRTYLTQGNGSVSPSTYSQTREPLPGMQLTNEVNMMVFFTLAGSNTGWTGSLEVGNRASTLPTFPPVATDSGGPDQDKQHFVRFGRNDGAATLAVGPSNSVVLRHDATLQAFGSVVTIGNLFSDGNHGGDGFFGNELVTNTYLENGGTAAGTFVINQTSNRVFQGVIRDGTYYSPDSTNRAAASLSIVKRGSGLLVFDQSNYYTGTTAIEAGTLRVNGRHDGGGLYTVAGTGTLGGTGVIASAGVVISDGGTLAPGNSPGTLTIDGDLTFSNASMFSVDLSGVSTNAGGGINDLVIGVRNLVLDGLLQVSWTNGWAGWTTNDHWTLMTYDGELTDAGLEIDMAGMPALGDGLSWYVDTRIDGEVRLSVLVPEPGGWLAVGAGLGLAIVVARARRKAKSRLT